MKYICIECSHESENGKHFDTDFWCNDCADSPAPTNEELVYIFGSDGV